MNKGGLFLVIGDSITWTISDEAAVGEDLWTQKLYRWIQSNYGEVQFINKGFGGAKSDTILESRYWLSRFIPDLLLVSTGVNDASNSISIEDYTANLTELVNIFRKKNPNILIILCSPTHSTNEPTYDVDDYRTAVASLATSLNTGIIHLENAFTLAQVGTYTVDGLHPNVAGHQLLFETAYPVVESYAADWLNKIRN